MDIIEFFYACVLLAFAVFLIRGFFNFCRTGYFFCNDPLYRKFLKDDNKKETKIVDEIITNAINLSKKAKIKK